MKPRIPIEIVVAVLAGISCLVTLQAVGGFPVWALFIGWAWYFALGATPAAFKQIIPAIFPGAILAGLCIWAWLGLFNGSFLGMVITVIISVLLLMYSLKIPACSASLPAFNAYSSVFAFFTICSNAGSFPLGATSLLGTILAVMLWCIIANALGPVFGWLSIVGQFPKK